VGGVRPTHKDTDEGAAPYPERGHATKQQRSQPIWYLIAATICLCWGTYLRATGHSWAGTILRPVIGLGAFAIAISFYTIGLVIIVLFVLAGLARSLI